MDWITSLNIYEHHHRSLSPTICSQNLQDKIACTKLGTHQLPQRGLNILVAGWWWQHNLAKNFLAALSESIQFFPSFQMPFANTSGFKYRCLHWFNYIYLFHVGTVRLVKCLCIGFERFAWKAVQKNCMLIFLLTHSIVPLVW